jgi:hypothetical protein
VHSIGGIIPTALAIAFVPQLCAALLARLLHPGRAVAQRLLQPRPCGPTLEPILARAVWTPEKRKPQEIQAALGVFLVSTATQAARFLRGECQAILREPLAPHPRDTLRLTLALEGADEGVGLATQRGLAGAVGLYHLCTPPIQGVMEIKLGQDG